ncbi:MAG: hypothetical protein ACR2OO_08045 [Thermomicrobiales bacterium]
MGEGLLDPTEDAASVRVTVPVGMLMRAATVAMSVVIASLFLLSAHRAPRSLDGPAHSKGSEPLRMYDTKFASRVQALIMEC